MSTEWGVMLEHDQREPHRSGMTELEARSWIREFEEDGGRVGAFYAIKREIGEWEAVATLTEDQEHIPNRSMVLTSNPPQFYCSNPNCYSHRCDWEGWTR